MRLSAQNKEVVVLCDLSVQCLRFWNKIDAEIAGLGEPADDSDRRIRGLTKIIYRSDSLKNVKLL